MAFYEDDELNKQQEEGGGKALSPESGLINAEGSAPSAGGPGNVESTKPVQSPFVGIQNYVKLNQPGTQKLAQNISSNVTDLGNQARNSISQAKNQFNQDVDQNTVGINENVFNKAKTNAENLSDNEKNTFKNMLNAQYKGPTDLESTDYFKGIKDTVNKAKDASENLNSNIAELAKQQQHKGSSNQGIANFDAALLGADKGARNTLNQAKQSVSDIPASLTQAQSDSALKAQQAANTTNATQQAVQSTFGNNALQVELQKMLQKRAMDAQNKAIQNADKLLSDLKGNKKLNQSELDLLGVGKDLSSPNAKILANLPKNASNYVTKENVLDTITPENIASAEEYARYAALNDLMGVSGDNFLSNPSLAGGADLNPINFDFKKASKDIADKKALEASEAAKKKEAEKAAALAEAEKQKKLQQVMSTANKPTGVSQGLWNDLIMRALK